VWRVVASWRERLERGESVDPALDVAACPESAERLLRALAALRLLVRAFPPSGRSERAS
jgi:hypothetical protein